MNITKNSIPKYKSLLKELIKRDYPYLIMGLLVVISAGTFLYFQLSPVRGLNVLNLQTDSDILQQDVLERTTRIVDLIDQQGIDYISSTPESGENINNKSTLSRPEENGQISAISSDQVTYTQKTYTVQQDDNLEYIAGLVYGDREAWPIIAEANDLANPDAIYAGMVLVIPR